ncbi:MAG: chromate transporter [Chloroflexi bacterium]|nr:chromate transporter [Chloroflexota bacterium]
MIQPLQFFLIFLKASLLSFGGLGNLPFLHADLIALGWAQEPDFLTAIAVGQMSPGPSGLWSISLGYLTYGWPGAALSLIALLVPPFLILPLVALYTRVDGHPGVKSFSNGLMLGAIGLLLGTAGVLSGTVITDAWALAIVTGAAALALTKRVPTIVILLLAALAGVVIYL